MEPRIRITICSLTVGFLALLTILPAWGQTNSHARIVRLSYVEGNVTLARPDVQGWAQAPVNTPIQEGFKLSTGDNSFAEVQVENGGTFRLGQFSLLDFKALELSPDGSKFNHLELHQGYATFQQLASKTADALLVDTPYGTMRAQGGAEFRVDLDQGAERVEVFHGSVDVQSNLGGMTLNKDEVLLMEPGTDQPTTVSQGITKDDWDQWVNDRDSEEEMPANGPSPEEYGDEGGGAPYGWSDLQHYGTWSNVPGEGMGWVPGGVPPGWAPYASGQWCWYPGVGYAWIGTEPWGWLPYHYGGWEFVAGLGWVWFPNALNVWSPSQVVWYTGPGWVGWRPRPHRPNGAMTCHEHCGGGVISTDTFRQGGLLSANVMLPVNPSTGTVVKGPGGVPTRAAKLVGQALSLPASATRGRAERPAGVPGGAASSEAVTASSRPRHPNGVNPRPAIVFDPQQDGYVNNPRVRPAQQPPATRPGAWVTQSPGQVTPAVHGPAAPSSNPGMMQPVPVTGREPGEHGSERSVSGPVMTPGSSINRPAAPAPRVNPPAVHGNPGESHAGAAHSEGPSAPAASHASPPSGGGGHSGGGPGGHR